MKPRVKLFKAALYSKVTIAVFVAVQDAATSYKYTQLNPYPANVENMVSC
jgi:hypothetical protein